MVIGFLLVKLGVLKGEDSVALSRVSLYLLMPSAVINSFQIDLTDEILAGFLLACAAGIAFHVIFVLIDRLYARFARATVAERASVFYSNAANLIIPIVAFVLGEEWVIYSTGFMAVQLIFLWTHGISLFERGAKPNIKKILLNPTILAIAVGALLMFAHVKLPAFVSGITASLGGVLGYVGMLIAGITAASLDFGSILKKPRLYSTVAMRVIVTPAIVLGIIVLALTFIDIPNADKILLVSFLATTTPSAATIIQLARLYDTESDYTVAINIVSTVASCATIPLFVLLYQAII
jgi:predicted permease